jgi:hypothetical protein
MTSSVDFAPSVTLYEMIEMNRVSETQLERLEADICQGAANLTSALHAWLLLVAEFDRREGWARWETQSCAAWLSWQVGLDMRAAREKVRVARALTEFPLISAAMAAGQLSYSKVRAITRIVEPETERALVDMALAGTSNHVEKIVTAFRRSEPVTAEAEQAQHDRRSFGHRIDDDGSIVVTIRLPAEPGRALLAAVERFTVTEPHCDLAQCRADGLIDMAECAVANIDQPATGTDRYLVTMHVHGTTSDAEDSQCTIATGDGTSTADATSTGHVSVSRDLARRLCCDACMETLIADSAGNPLHLGRRSRIVPDRLRRAARLRDGRCRFPGCTRKGWVDIHHIVHWADGGHTDIDNVMCLCRTHHRAVHEGGWTITGTPQGVVQFVAPSGQTVNDVITAPIGDKTHVDAHQRTATDARCRWLGERLDLSMALDALHSRRPHPTCPAGTLPGECG